MRRALAVAIIFGLLIIGSLAAQQMRAGSEPRAVPPVAVGQEMFHSYCASCHGLDGKGAGSTAPALKKQPPDLTLLSRKNGHKFPSALVSSVIQGNDFITDHGSRDMPIWGDAFRASNRDEAMIKLKIRNLTLYIESIQQK